MVESMNFIKIYQMAIEEQHLNYKSINAKMNSEWASYIVIWRTFGGLFSNFLAWLPYYEIVSNIYYASFFPSVDPF